MSRPPNLCVYCGSPGVTKEHFWGAWSRKFSLGDYTKNDHRVRRYADPYAWDSARVEKGALTRPGIPRSQTLKIACKSCNNGWMKNIVDEAIPILSSMTHGYWGNLNPDERRKLASWITLFSMSYEFADKETVCVSERERHSFRESGVPSDCWHLAIGYAEPTPGAEPIFHRGFKLESDSWNGHRLFQSTAFLFGQLVALAFYAEFELPFNWESCVSKIGLAQLWPETGKGLHKPFRTHYDDAPDVITGSVTDAITAAFDQNGHVT